MLRPRLEQNIGVMLVLTLVLTDCYENEHISIMHVLINVPISIVIRVAKLRARAWAREDELITRRLLKLHRMRTND